MPLTPRCNETRMYSNVEQKKVVVPEEGIDMDDFEPEPEEGADDDDPDDIC